MSNLTLSLISYLTWHIISCNAISSHLILLTHRHKLWGVYCTYIEDKWRWNIRNWCIKKSDLYKFKQVYTECRCLWRCEGTTIDVPVGESIQTAMNDATIAAGWNAQQTQRRLRKHIYRDKTPTKVKTLHHVTSPPSLKSSSDCMIWLSIFEVPYLRYLLFYDYLYMMNNRHLNKGHGWIILQIPTEPLFGADTKPYRNLT